MTILVFGQSGQLAQALARADVRVTTRGRAACDLTNAETIAGVIEAARPTAVINAAAYTGVDAAETDADAAHAINAMAPGAMAVACTASGIPFVHVSTDYVFDGAGTDPIAPDAPTGPLGVYGRSKLAGEVAVRASGATHAILRTAAIFSADGQNFLKTMLRLSDTRDQLNIVADQITCPTPAAALAGACLTVADALTANPDKTGTYHFAGQPPSSWADFARAIFDAAGREVTVTDIPARDYPTPAARPSNSRLDCATLTQEFGIIPPQWQDHLPGIIAKVTA